MRNANSCIQPHEENIWKTPKENAEHNARATIQNSENILGPQGNVTTIGASEYISRAQEASKPHLQHRYQVQLPELQINNKLWSPHKIWLVTTQHTTATPLAPSPTHYHPTPLTNSDYRSCTLIPHHSMLSLIQPAYPQLLLNPFIRL